MQHPDPVTAEQLAARTGKDAAEFTDALAGIDQDALYTTERGALVAGVWDQASPVNGVDAPAVLESLQVPAGGAVVTIAGTDGSVMILQPFDPNTPGMVAIDPEDAQALADRMAQDMASERARAQALAQLPAELRPTGAASAAPAADAAVDLGPLQQQLADTQAALSDTQAALDWLTNYVITGEA